MRRNQRKSWTCIGFTLSITFVCLILLGALFMNNGIQAVESFGYDDYGDQYGEAGSDKDGGHHPSTREDMMSDINSQRSGYPNELSTKFKTFKLFEKRRLTHEKAKAFCKKREGQLAQATNLDEMQRIQTLLMRGTSISSNVWVGADKREWKKHSSKLLGLRPNLPPNAMMMGGGPTSMCPAMSISTRSLAPVECFKEFPFICEFPPGKGKPPPPSKNAKKKKTTRKDEMRRKREIIELSPGVEGLSSTQPYGFTGLSSTDDIRGVVTTGSEDESDQGVTGSVDEYERHHSLSFHPHVVFSSMKFPSEGHMPSTSPSSDRVHDNSGATGQKFTSLGSPNQIVGNGVDGLDAENAPDPDQQMLNLFDEQLENMRQIISQDENLLGPVTGQLQPKPYITKSKDAENIELTSKLPIDKTSLTTPSLLDDEEQFVTDNRIHPEVESTSSSTEATQSDLGDFTTQNGLESPGPSSVAEVVTNETNLNPTTRLSQKDSTMRFTEARRKSM